MEGLRKIAKAHYTNGSERVKELAHAFFDAMDEDGDGEVSLTEFMDFMTQEGHEGMDNPDFFDWLDRDENGTLDFWEVMTLYYIVKSGRPFCEKCQVLVTGTYFACTECFESRRGPYCLCRECYASKRWGHDHNGRCQFLDNYTLLETMRISAINQRRYQPSNSNALVPVRQGSSNNTYYARTESQRPSTSNAIVPARQGTVRNQWKVAYKAFDTALSIGNFAASTASLCTIL